MAKQGKTRQSRRNVEFGRRTLWLAGLGAVSLGRKQASATFEAINAGAVKLRERARADLSGAIGQASGVIGQAGERAGSKLVEGREKARALLQPVMVKLGLAKAQARRKPAPRKAASRRSTARKPARAAA